MKSAIGGEPAGVQLGIAARQIDRVRAGVRWLIGEWRERQDLGAGDPPALERRGVGEGEREIARDRDPLAERPQRSRGRPVETEPERPRKTDQPVEIGVRRDDFGRAVEPGLELGHLGGGHQTEVARRQLEAEIARQAGQHRLREAVVAGAPEQRRVLGAGDPIEHDAGDLDVVAMPGEALDQRGRRGAHAAHVDDQHDRQIEQARQIRGRALAVAGAIEQAHDPFAEHQLAAVCDPVAEGCEGLDAHRPAVEIDRGPAGRAGMEGRVDVVGADLERADREASAPEGAQQGQRDRRLAAPGRRRGDDDPGRAHRFRLIGGLPWPDGWMKIALLMVRIALLMVWQV